MAKFTVNTPTGAVSVEAPSRDAALDHVLNTSGPNVSTLGSLGRGAVGMLPLGDQAYAGIAGAVEHKPYLQERQELNQEIAADKEENPGARLAGQALGVAAPIVATGGLAAPETLLGAAGQGALFGGAYGAGNAIDTLASGGSGAKAAGDVAIGAGLGAAGGAAAQGLGNLLGSGAEAVKNSQVGQRLQAENVSKALGLAPGALKALGNEAGTTPEAAVQGIWKDIQNLPGLPENFVHPTGSINEKVGMLRNIQQQAGEAIGGVRKAAGAATADSFPEGAAAIKDLTALAQDNVGLPSEGIIKGAATNLQAMAEKGKLDFDRMTSLRSNIGEAVHSDVPGSHQVYKVFSQHLDGALDRLGDTPGIDKTAFQAAKKAYATTSKLIPLMQRGAGREASGTGGGLSNLLGIGGTLMGHPAAAVAPVAHEMQKVAAPQMIHNLMLGGLPDAGIAGAAPLAGAQIASSQMSTNPDTTPKSAATDLHLQHPALARYVETFKRNAANAKDPGEAAKSEAITAFKLSQTDPNFVDAQQKSNEAPHATNMAAGGVVPGDLSQNKDTSVLSRLKDNFGKPIPGFGSSLPGLEKVTHDIVSPPQAEPAQVVRTAAPDNFHKSFNPQFEEQLRAYITKSKEGQDAK